MDTQLLTELTDILKKSGYLQLQKLPGLKRPGWKFFMEPFVLLSYVLGRNHLFSPTCFPDLYPAIFFHKNRRLRTFYSFFFANRPVPFKRISEELGTGLTEQLIEKDIIRRTAGDLVSIYRFIPYGDTIFLSDPDQGIFRTIKHYVYIGGDSVLLAEFVNNNMLDRKYERALDLCAGTGFQGHNIKNHADQVVAAEYNPRAVKFAEIIALMNKTFDGFQIIHSDMLENVKGSFDLIVSNPPYYPVPSSNWKEINLDVFGGNEYGMEKPVKIFTGLKTYLREGGRAAFLASSVIKNRKNLLAERLKPLAEDLGLKTILHPWKITNIQVDKEYQRKEGISYLILYIVEVTKGATGFHVRKTIHPELCVQRIYMLLENAVRKFQKYHPGEK